MKTMNQFEKIYIINLTKNSDRRDYISKLMLENNISFEFFEAVDGAELLNSEELYLKFCEENFLDCSNWKPNHGQIGCWLSHVAIWKKIVKDNIESCLILEDDIVLNFPDANESFLKNFNDYYNKLPNDWNIFMPGYCGGHLRPINDKIVQLYHPACTHAYALKKSAAKVLINHYWPMRGALDAFTGHIFFAGNSTEELRKSYEQNWDENRCNHNSLYNPEKNMSLVSNLKGYASAVCLFNQGSSDYSTC